MPDPIDPETLDNLAQSIADHSYENHGHEFRNEKPDGSPRSSSPKKSYGEALEVHNRGDLAEHIKDIMQSPDTRYFIDPRPGADGKMVFFNEKTGTTVIFNPHQLGDGDGHAGTVFREKVREYGNAFNTELNITTEGLGQAPEIRNAADGQWRLPPEVFQSPTGRSAAHARANPPLEPGAQLPDAIRHANKLEVAEGVKEISKLAKAGRLGANITGVGIVIGVASAVLMQEAHAAQRDFAGDLRNAGILDDEAYNAYLELNNDTQGLLYGDLALSTADPTGLSIVITAGAEGKARGDFKEWADEHAPGLSEEHFQTLSMSMFPDNSARADMVWEARDQLPSTTEGQPEFMHKSIELNALYDEARGIGYSHKAGYVYGGNLSETLAAARNMGIEVEVDRMNPSTTIRNLRSAIKQELMQEMDQNLSNPATIDSMLDTVPAGDRLEYVRRLVASEDNMEQFAQDHPEIAAYIKEYDESWFGWEWTMDSDDPLKANPDLLNDYIKERTLPDQSAPDNRYGSLNQTPNAVIDRTSQVATILPSDASITVQSSDNNASVARGAVADDQIRLMQDENTDPATLPEVEQQRELRALHEQERQQELVAQQAEQQKYLDQQQQINGPSSPTN